MATRSGAARTSAEACARIRRFERWIQPEAEQVTEAGGPHQPERIILEDALRDGHQAALPQVLQTPEGIDDGAFPQGHGHGVDREVPLGEIVDDTGAPHRRDIDVAFGAHHPVGPVTGGQSEPGRCQPGGDLPGHAGRIVGHHHVQIGGIASQLAVAHGTADQPAFGPAAPQDVGHDLQHHLAPLGAATWTSPSTCADAAGT